MSEGIWHSHFHEGTALKHSHPSLPFLVLHRLTLAQPTCTLGRLNQSPSMKSTSHRWYNWKDLKEGTAYGGVIQVKGIHRVLRQTQRLVGSRYYPCKLARGKGQRESYQRLCELESWRNWSCGGAQPGPYKVQSWILSPPTLQSPAGVSPYRVQSEASWWGSPAEAVHWDGFPEYRCETEKGGEGMREGRGRPRIASTWTHRTVLSFIPWTLGRLLPPPTSAPRAGPHSSIASFTPLALSFLTQSSFSKEPSLLWEKWKTGPPGGSWWAWEWTYWVCKLVFRNLNRSGEKRSISRAWFMENRKFQTERWWWVRYCIMVPVALWPPEEQWSVRATPLTFAR